METCSIKMINLVGCVVFRVAQGYSNYILNHLKLVRWMPVEKQEQRCFTRCSRDEFGVTACFILIFCETLRTYKRSGST